MAFAARIKNHAATAAVVAALLVAGLGVTAFVLALRPSRLHFTPGQLITYHLKTEISEVIETQDRKDQELPPMVQESDLHLICVGPDNTAVLLAKADGRDQVALMTFAANGMARELDAASRPSDSGRAVGFFDFNLLPLPPGSEQIWNVDLTYAVLPPGKRSLQAKARRTRSGANPEFQLKLPASVEWVGEDQRYLQVRDLTSQYRFNTSKGVIEEATVRCLAGYERPEGRRRHKLKLTLSLVSIGTITDDPGQVRDLAIACTDAQTALAAGRKERLAAISQRLTSVTVQDPRLRALAESVIGEIRNGPRPAQPTGPRGLWAVHLASGPAELRADAQRFVDNLAGLGFRAYLAAQGPTLSVLVGPYYDRDPAVIRSLSQRFPQQRATWVEVKP
jgi:SPOR domain